MSVPHPTGASQSRTESQDDATQLMSSPSDEAATIVEGTHVANSKAPPGQTLIESPEQEAATIVDPSLSLGANLASSNANDPDATIADPSPSLDNPESAVQTIIDPVSQDAAATFPEIEATAGSSSAARGWAPTKGATGAAWPQPLPNSANKPQPPQRPLNAPRAEDRYRLLDNFAHGGLGNIWRAEDTAIHRQIAFKELLPKALKNRVIVERFLEEAQITGQLEHPGIVPIYDVGYQENGTPFYAMKLLKGGNMEEAIEAMHAFAPGSTERQLAFTRLLRQFIAVCQAVGFAHEKGVLHRDLKPLNVMLGEFGETLVLDWGLAKVVDVLGQQEIATDSGGQLDSADPNVSVDGATIAESSATDAGWAVTKEAITKDGATAPSMTSGGATNASATSAGATQSGRTEAATAFRRQVTTDARTVGSQTMMGQIMGTPAYMPPEQAQGLIKELDARTDIYSLGGILYKLLTNRQPVARGKPQDVLIKVIRGEIVRPREIDPSIHPALEAICRKAMALLQADRYAKALDLAADVEAWLADEPVSVYPDRWQTKLRRWYKRNRAVVHGAGIAVGVIIAAGVTWSVIETQRINGLRLAASSKAQEAQAATEQADFVKASSLLTEALGQVKAETNLAQLRDRIQSDLDNVARLQAAAERARLAELRTKTQRLLDDARQAIEEAKDYAQARTLLTEAVTLIANESALTDLHRQAQSRLAEVNQALAQQSEVEAAKALLTKFKQSVEDVRVYSTRLSGDDSIDDLRQAYKLGLETQRMFAFDADKPVQLDPRLTLLGPKAVEQWREAMFELLFTTAQAEISLATKDQADDVQVAARQSLARIREAEQLGCVSPALSTLKADIFFVLGQQAEMDVALQEVKRLPAKTRFDHFSLGEMARRRHDDQAAVRHYQNALEAAPDDFWSLFMLGDCDLRVGLVDSAVTAYTACIARRPDAFWPYLVRGYAFSELRQYEQAQRDFDKALGLTRQPYHVFLNRGVAFLKQKNYDAARADFLRAAELRPDLSAPHENLADLSRIRGRELATSDAPEGVVRAAAEFQTALAELTKALPLSPQQATLYHARGMIRVALADPAAAIDDFQRAIRLSPNPVVRAASFREIGLIHQRAKKLPEALAAFDQSLSQNPRDTNVIRQRAEVLLALGQNSEAIAGFTKFLEAEGPVGDVYRARGLAFAKLEKYREAINDYTMSLQYEPAPNMLKQRGKAYLLQATQLAKEDFEESLRLNPVDPDARWGLAHAMVLLGDHAAGVAELEKAAATNKRAAAQFGPQAWPLLFNPATTYAQASAKASIDPRLSSEQRTEVAAKYVARAVELLTDAQRTAGPKFRDDLANELRTDTTLDPIRQRPEFIELLKSVDSNSK